MWGRVHRSYFQIEKSETNIIEDKGYSVREDEEGRKPGGYEGSGFVDEGVVGTGIISSMMMLYLECK